jgi:hypothetical protein
MFPKGTDKVGQKVKPHNRFIAFFYFVLCVGQLAEFTRCVLIWVGQKVKPHNRFIAFLTLKKLYKIKRWVFGKNKLCVMCGAVSWVHHTCFDMGRSKGQAA